MINIYEDGIYTLNLKFAEVFKENKIMQIKNKNFKNSFILKKRTKEFLM